MRSLHSPQKVHKIKIEGFIAQTKKPSELFSFQAKVDHELFKNVQAKKEKDGLTWTEIVEGLFRAYLNAK